MRHDSAVARPTVEEARAARSATEQPALPPGWQTALDALHRGELDDARLPAALTFEPEPAHEAAFTRFATEVAELSWTRYVEKQRAAWQQLREPRLIFERYLVERIVDDEWLAVFEKPGGSDFEAALAARLAAGDADVIEEAHQLFVRGDRDNWLRPLYHYQPASFHRVDVGTGLMTAPMTLPAASVAARKQEPRPSIAPMPGLKCEAVLKAVREYQKRHGATRTRLSVNQILKLVGGKREDVREATHLLLRDGKLFDQNLGRLKQLAIRLADGE